MSSLGVAVGVIRGTSEYSLGVDIIDLVVFGILIIGGLFLFRRGLSQRGGSLTGSDATASGPTTVMKALHLILILS